MYIIDYDIRLQNGTSDNEGRVEVRKDQGPWGTVCDYNFDTDDGGNMMCRMLRFFG